MRIILQRRGQLKVTLLGVFQKTQLTFPQILPALWSGYVCTRYSKIWTPAISAPFKNSTTPNGSTELYVSRTLFHLILTATLWGMYYSSYTKNRKIDVTGKSLAQGHRAYNWQQKRVKSRLWGSHTLLTIDSTIPNTVFLVLGGRG
jgi:hypothetical protein